MNRSLLSVTRFFSFPLLLLLGSWFCIPAFALDGDENWDDGYGLPGFDESVQQIVVAADETVFVFGNFQHVDGVQANFSLAVWDGQSWSQAVQQASNIDGLARDASGDVYGTGYFFDGTNGEFTIARWENDSWQPFAVGLDGNVDRLTFTADNRIFASGFNLSVNDSATGSVAEFDGTSWQIVGVLGNSNSDYTEVNDMKADSNGQLFITGVFDSVNGVAANGIARLDGTGWHALGGGLVESRSQSTGSGTALEISASDVVYVAGNFDEVDGISLANQSQVVAWTDGIWSTPFSGASVAITGYNVGDLLIDQDSGDLIVAGRGVLSQQQGGESGGILYRWNGSDWEDIAPSLFTGSYGGGIYAIAQSAAGEMYIGGDFNGDTEAGAYIGRFAKSVGDDWEPVTLSSGSGANGNIQKMVQADNGDVYVSGPFSYLDGQRNTGVMKFSGGSWSPVMAAGFDGRYLQSMVISPEQELYVSGLSSSSSAHSIYRWSGNTWVPFGPYLNGIRAFTFGADGAVYAVHTHYENNASQTRAVRLVGDTWVPLGGEFTDEGQSYVSVDTLLVTSEAEFVVAGRFSNVGDVAARHIALWDGTAWNALGSGPNLDQYGYVQDVAEDSDGLLYVAGRLRNDAEEPAIAASWDGASWTYLSPPASNFGESTALSFSPNGELIVGGNFSVTQDYSSSGVAAWNGTSWRAFGSGVPYGVVDLEALADGSLLVGGFFNRAGGAASSKVAYWVGSQQAGLPAIASPAAGSELTSTTATFSWVSNGTPVDEWWLYVGNAPGSASYFDSKNLRSETSVEVSGLPENGELLHVRLFYRQTGESWSSVDSTYRAAEGAVVSLPEIQDPVDGATLTSDSQTVSWLANSTAVDEWWLFAGDAVGSSSYFDSGNLDDATSVLVTGLPVDETTVYVRLFYRQSGARWSSIDVTYTAASSTTEPAFDSPVPGTVLTGDTETFSWLSNGQSVDEWWLYAGSSVGSKSYFDSGNLGNSLDLAVTGLPTDGTTVYVRLFYRETGSSWSKIDATYTAVSGPSEPGLVSPADALTSGSQTFEWAANGVAVDQWWLYVGSAVGDNSYFDSGNLRNATSVLVEGLPVDGSAVYARLYYRESGGRWSHVDSTHTASDLPSGVPEISGPTDGSSLLVGSTEFHWQANGATVDEWWLYVGDVVGGNSYFDSGNLGAATHVAVTGLPTDGSTFYARLFYRQAGERWSRVDSTYVGLGGGSPFTTDYLSDRYLVPVVEQFAAGRTAFRLDADGMTNIADIGDTDGVLRYGEFPWSVDGDGRIVADFTSVEAGLTCDYAPLATLGDQLDVAVSCTTGSIDRIGKYYLSKPFSSQDLTGKTIDINGKFSVSFGANSVAAVTELADGSEYDITYSDSTYQAVELNRTNVSAFVLLAGTIDDGLLMMWSYGDEGEFGTVEFFETTSDSWTSVYRRDRD